MNRIPSFRSPTEVTLPPNKGLILVESPPKQTQWPSRGGGRSTGTVEMSAVTVGDDLSGSLTVDSVIAPVIDVAIGADQAPVVDTTFQHGADELVRLRC